MLLSSSYNECVNKYIPDRTEKEWREDNKEKLQEYQEKYKEDNKERIKQHFAQHYQNNKETKIEQARKYYKVNKEAILERKRKQTVVCECGSTMRKDSKLEHERTKKHMQFRKSISISDLH